MYKAFTLFSLGLLSFFSFFAPVAYSQNDCTIVYGGGEIACEATVSATAKVTPTPTLTAGQKPAVNSGQTTTKGGLPIHEPSKATETPATGPEALALIGLLPAAAVGLWLRKR